MQIINGKAIAQEVKDGLCRKIETLRQQGKRIPKLSVVLIGTHAASATYVRNKERACAAIGMESDTIRLPETITQEELLAQIEQLNEDPMVDGILVQLPLPRQIDERKVLNAIDPGKDVDGFHPVNIGRLLIGEPASVPCTPKGIIRMLEAIGMDDLSGRHAIVIGRSNIVGKPIALLLLAKHATVTIAHSRTADLSALCREADIVIAAVGVPRLVKADWIKEGAVVIDVGINRDENGKLCGDVDFDDVKNVAQALSPVPGGVGPMTIAMLLSNTLAAYEEHEGGR